MTIFNSNLSYLDTGRTWRRYWTSESRAAEDGSSIKEAGNDDFEDDLEDSDEVEDDMEEEEDYEGDERNHRERCETREVGDTEARRRNDADADF